LRFADVDIIVQKPFSGLTVQDTARKPGNFNLHLWQAPSINTSSKIKNNILKDFYRN
jgi:hypothetical protein